MSIAKKALALFRATFSCHLKAVGNPGHPTLEVWIEIPKSPGFNTKFWISSLHSLLVNGYLQSLNNNVVINKNAIHNLCVFFNSEFKLSCLFHLYSFYFYHSQWCYITTERHLLQLYFTRQLSASVTVQSPLTIVETFSSRILKYSLLHVHFPGSLSPRTFKLILCSDHQVYNLVISCCIHWVWRQHEWECDSPSCGVLCVRY